MRFPAAGAPFRPRSTPPHLTDRSGSSGAGSPEVPGERGCPWTRHRPARTVAVRCGSGDAGHRPTRNRRECTRRHLGETRVSRGRARAGMSPRRSVPDPRPEAVTESTTDTGRPDDRLRSAGVHVTARCRTRRRGPVAPAAPAPPPGARRFPARRTGHRKGRGKPRVRIRPGRRRIRVGVLHGTSRIAFRHGGAGSRGRRRGGGSGRSVRDGRTGQRGRDPS